MKKFLNNLKQEAQHIRMSDAERSAMRTRIFEGQSLKSPELRTVLGRRSPYVFMSYHLRMTMAGLLLFVIAGTGTVSAAAAGALPGDLLYPIKVSVNEKVEVALAPTPAAKSEVQVRLAERRVDEARELSVRGRLDKKTAKALSDNFDEHAAQAVALAEPDGQAVEPAGVSLQVKMQVREQENSAPRAASMMIQVAAEATTSPEQWEQPDKKSEKRRGSLRESLRAKGEILQELKDRAPETELQIRD